MVRELPVLAVQHTDLINVPVAILGTIYRLRHLIYINVDTKTAIAQTVQALPELIVRQTVMTNVFHVIMDTIYQTMVVT